MFTTFPLNLQLSIVSFLDRNSLGVLARVSKSMYGLVEQTRNKQAEEIVRMIAERHNYIKTEDIYLFAYSQLGWVKCLRKAISEGADVNVRLYFDKSDEIFVTPIHMAAGFGMLDCVKLLVANGAIFKPQQPQKYFLSPLHYAAAMGNTDCITYFLEQSVPVDQQSTISCPLGWNWTPLQIAANRGHAECVSLLIKKNADVHINDPDHYQAIHRAVGNTECLRILLENNADPNAANEDGITPLLLAVSGGYSDCVELLLQNNASTLTQSFLCHRCATVLQIAVHNNDLRIAKILLDHDKKLVNQTHFITGHTALHIAVKEKNKEMLKLFLNTQYEADLTIKISRGGQNKGKTALDLAKEDGDQEIIELLDPPKPCICFSRL
jgi:ankyrin repeat protein